jgi:Zn-dependent M28 family amino/carboxypeptidase
LILVSLWLTLARPFVLFTAEKQAHLEADPAALKADTLRISTEFFPRDWESPENLDRAADFIKAELEKGADQVSLQSYTVGNKEYRNVIAEYGLSNAKGTIVIGAHYDTSGKLPGADDNASGVAGLLELGRLLARQRPDYRIVLVAYTLEEPPFFASEYMGSAVHAASLVATGEKVRLMISLEMIGYFSDAPRSQSYPSRLLHLFYPSRGDFLAIVGPFTLSPVTVDLKRAFMTAVSLPVVSINAPAFIPGVDFSDHRNYWHHGFDAVMLTDTAFFRNHAYHTANDTADRLDYQKMGEVVTGLYYYLLQQ